jgi:hypothetical protein
MRFILLVITVSILAALAEYFAPWWLIAVVAFVVALVAGLKPGQSFLMGFLGIALFWFVAALISDYANDHILANRMAKVFHLPGGILFILVSAIIGGIVGGLASWSGGLFSSRPRS